MSPSLIYFPQSYYNRYQVPTVFMNMTHTFGVINVDFTPIKGIDVKSFPNSELWQYFFFSYCKLVFQSFPIFLWSHLINISPDSFLASPAKSNTILILLIFLHCHPQNFPNTDVVTIDKFLNVDNKIADTETHHIHDQS